MKRSLFLMGLATGLGLSGLNVAAMELTDQQTQAANHLAEAIAAENEIAVQRLFDEAFPVNLFVANVQPQTALRLLDAFDNVVRAAISEIIIKQTHDDSNKEYYCKRFLRQKNAGQLYCALMDSKMLPFEEKMGITVPAIFFGGAYV